jgi:hypothetical protein
MSSFLETVMLKNWLLSEGDLDRSEDPSGSNDRKGQVDEVEHLALPLHGLTQHDRDHLRGSPHILQLQILPQKVKLFAMRIF